MPQHLRWCKYFKPNILMVLTPPFGSLAGPVNGSASKTEHLLTIPDTQVHLEPFIANTQGRNNILVTGSRQSGMASCEYDITVCPLPPSRPGLWHPHLTPPAPQWNLPLQRPNASCHHCKGEGPAPTGRCHSALYPSGVHCWWTHGEDNSRHHQDLEDSLPSGTFRSLLVKLSLALVRARVRNFDL